jgi:hypothetical protein
MGSLWWVCLYGRPYAKAKKKKSFVGWPFCKGPSKRAGVVLKKIRIYQMILKNIWLFPIAYCDTAEPWQLGFQDTATPMMQGIIECA